MSYSGPNWTNKSHTNTEIRLHRSSEQGKTYDFRMFCLRKMGQDRSLNTPKDDDRCVISVTTKFQEPHPTQQDVSLTNTKEMTAENLGVHSVTRNYGCCACKRKVNLSANGNWLSALLKVAE